jgi:hypothetical protein
MAGTLRGNPAAGSPEALARGAAAHAARLRNQERRAQGLPPILPSKGSGKHRKTGRPTGRPSRAESAARGAVNTQSASSPQPSPEQVPLRGPAKLSAVAQRNAKTLITIAIAGSDNIAARLVPQHWTAEDRLAQEETVMLVAAVYAATPAKVLEWLAKAAEQGVYVQLAYAIGMVALPRLVRRGLVPADVALLFFLAANQPQPPAAADQDAATVESGATPEPDRDNGNGQVYAGFVPGRGAPVHGGFQVETG